VAGGDAQSANNSQFTDSQSCFFCVFVYDEKHMIETAAPPNSAASVSLAALGALLKAQRKALKVSAVAAAESAGMSRITLHRIERGLPTVTVGAVQALAQALGCSLQLAGPAGNGLASAVKAPSGSMANANPEAALARATQASQQAITLRDYPQLRLLAWQRADADTVSPEEALSMYERNWRHVQQAALPAHEKALLAQLVATVGKGRLLV
jgi:transcriptional regulator with XRE-family HTH domain